MIRIFNALKRKALHNGINGFLFILDGAFINAAIILTTGAFISGFFVHLDTSDFIIGIVNTANLWASAFALLSYLIFNRIKKTKRFLMISNVVARFTICSIVLLPYIIGNGAATAYIAAIMVIVGNILWGIYSVGLNIWMMASFSRSERGSFVYLRTFWFRVSFALTSIIMGFVLDAFRGSSVGFVVVFSISFVFSLLDILALLRIPYVSGEGKGVNTMSPSLLIAPFKDKTFRNYLVFTLLFYLSIYVSSSFTSLYLIKYIGFSYKYISIATVASHMMMIVSVVFWKKYDMKKGTVRALKIASLMLAIEQLSYAFLFNGNVFIPFVAAFFNGVGTGGFNIIVFNYRYSIMPAENITNYETWFMVIHGLGIMLGPIVGNIVRPTFSVIFNSLSWFSEFQAMYVISTVVAVFSVFFFVGKRLTKKT